VLKKRLLLSVCCAPCATVAIERLIEDYDVTLYYWGDNLDSKEEFKKRNEEVEKLAEYFNLEVLDQAYQPFTPENCKQCFAGRLMSAGACAIYYEFDVFATSLTTSPHKDAELINEIGEEMAEFPCREFPGIIEYLPTDFKKNSGFERSVVLSKELGLYRQNYCGCARSKREKINKK